MSYTPFASIACNLDTYILQTALPLLESERVQAMEWSFDALYNRSSIPDWFEELLQVFAQEGRLIGHGVFFSLFSGHWSAEQTEWLQHLRQVAQRYPLAHVTEHFGFMTGADFHRGAPMAVPYNATTLRLGQERLQRIADAGQCPVGLENLAFAYTLDEVTEHGHFLEELIQPVNGFIILDLHNLYCQLHNFQVDYETLIARYPLGRVREIHVSGGSWETPESTPNQRIRRDTHDDSVPEEVFELLQKTIPRCPNLRFVVMEQLGTALDTPERQATYQADFYRMETIVTQAMPLHGLEVFLPQISPLPNIPFTDEQLHLQQRALANILETAPTVAEAQAILASSVLANSDWKVETWRPELLETAMAIAQKWR